MKRWPRSDAARMLRHALKWLVLGIGVALLAGTASAWFLLALAWATETRETHRWLLALLPLAGFAVGWVYLRVGQPVEAGNNLLIDEVHDPRQVVPVRMAPLIFLGTVVSHLCGASVGREGTAVQMGGALADQFTHLVRLKPDDRRILLMAGISAGFASVFGTPLAGAVLRARSTSSRARWAAVIGSGAAPVAGSCGAVDVAEAAFMAFPLGFGW